MNKKRPKKRIVPFRIKRQEALEKEEHQKIRNHALEEGNRIALAFMELAQDKIFKKLPEEGKMSLVREVLAIGVEVAEWVEKEYGTNDPRKIAANMGVKVFGEDKGKVKISEYRRQRKEIVVYRNIHEKLVEKVQPRELSENLLKYFVAHELFHHLEMIRIGEIYKRFKFKGFKLGPFVKEKYIKGLSNVAAQAFTLSLLKLYISPQVLDYLIYILYTNTDS